MPTVTNTPAEQILLKIDPCIQAVIRELGVTQVNYKSQYKRSRAIEFEYKDATIVIEVKTK